MQNNLFKKSSIEHFTSPEKLNDYIQVSTPSSWMVLGAALALLLGMLAWGIFGELSQSVSFSGVAKDGMLHCYVGSGVSEELEEGMEVTISPLADNKAGTIRGKVESIAASPLSYEEASASVESDYLKAVLEISSWNIVVEVSAEEALYDDIVYSISAVTEVQRPIDLVFR